MVYPLRISTLIAILAGALFFIAGFFIFIQTNEPIEVSLEDSTFVPVDVVTETKTPEETLPAYPTSTPPTLPKIEENILEESTPTPSATKPVVQSEPEPVPKEQVFVPKNLEQVDAGVREALVNILCIADPISPIGSISGSGIIIDEKGTILTNAHIAQEFLLKDYPEKDTISCVVRTGSPAKDAYTVELAYISPLWVFENKDAIAQKNPTGTGKDDFALLSITGATQFSTLPEKFPFIPITFEEAKMGEVVISAGYPASFLSSEAVRRNLVRISAAGIIEDVFTFNQTTVDVLSLGGVPLAQQGASGGAVVRSDGSLIGLVVTSSLEENTQERDLRAISTGHIARSFTEQHATTFKDYAFKNLVQERANFTANIAPQLRDILLRALGEI